MREFVDQAYDAARLGRSGVRRSRERVFAKALAQLEAAGDAMRYLDAKGRVAWKATPHLRDLVRNLELEAKVDLEDGA